MPYTLAMGFVWFLLAFLLGAIIGWLLRSIRANRQIARARAEHNDSAEVEALRGRVANLEPLVAERDKLKAELEACRSSKQGTAAVAGAAGVAAVAPAVSKSAQPAAPQHQAKPAAPVAPARPAAPEQAKPAAPAAPSAPARPAAPEQAKPAAPSAPAAPTQSSAPAAPAAPKAPAAPSAAGQSSASASGQSSASGSGQSSASAQPSVSAFAAPTGRALDLDAASAALGRKIKLDDLTVVEGIGPKISELCHGIGITTWRGLADTETSLLRTMLHDAGPRFQMHDPETWPRQAELLADGDWAAFKKLTDDLDGGRPN